LLPEYRGGDLMPRFYDYAMSICAQRGIQYVWGYTSAVKAWKRFGFQVSDVMWTSILNLRTLGTLAGIAHSGDKPSQKWKQAIDAICGSLRRNLPGIRKSRFRVMGELVTQSDMDDLYRRLRARFPGIIHIQFSEAYYRWRIRDNPVVKYATYYAYEHDSGQLCSYIFLALHRDRKTYVTDLTFATEEAGLAALSCALSHAGRTQCERLVYFGNRHNPLGRSVFAFLERFGFVSHPNPQMSFVLKDLRSTQDNGSMKDIARWYMCGLWTEGYTF
jgi:hypothetical protein